MEYVYSFLGYDIEYQLKLFFYSLILGASLGALFDLFRITRVFLSYRGEGRQIRALSDTVLCVVAFIEDISFAVLSAAVLVLFCFKANNGSARSYIFLGTLFGFVLYLISLGRITAALSNKLAELLHRLFSFLIRRIALPIANFLAKLTLKIYRKTIGRAAGALICRVYTMNTKRLSRELEKAIVRLYIDKRKEHGDETNSSANAGQAGNIRSLYNNDSHPRRSTNRVQSA